MKKVFALFLTVIAVFSLSSCGNSSSGFSKKNKQLTAENFTTLIDSNGFLYCMWDYSFNAFYFEDADASFKAVRLDDNLEIDYSRLANSSSYWNLDVYDASHFSISESDGWGSTYNFRLAYADPKGDYVIFIDSDYEEGDKFDYFSDALTCMNSELLKSVSNKLTSLTAEYTSYEDFIADYLSSVEGLVALIDSCK